MDNILSLLTTSSGETINVYTALAYSLVAGLLGLFISFTYLKTGKVSKNFARTLVILPILVCVVLISVNGNFGTSIAVLGAFSLIRFRSLQGSSRDIGFIFLTMTVGIVCAVGQPLFALSLTLIVCLIHFVLSAVNYGAKKGEEKDLRITIPENLDYSDIFDDLFDKYTNTVKLISVKTANMGSMYEIDYRVSLKDSIREKDFLDDIRMRNGNLTVYCGRCDINEAEEL
ncbi:MAG: DUF4956 domain-containing protein [Pseudobutyrivibrio sp.]|nr:DUF4956 domain-containing protein [Pseudobutyrivibrio sp.]